MPFLKKNSRLHLNSINQIQIVQAMVMIHGSSLEYIHGLKTDDQQLRKLSRVKQINQQVN